MNEETIRKEAEEMYPLVDQKNLMDMEFNVIQMERRFTHITAAKLYSERMEQERQRTQEAYKIVEKALTVIRHYSTDQLFLETPEESDRLWERFCSDTMEMKPILEALLNQ